MRTRSRNALVLLFDEVELLDFAGAVQVLSIAGRHYNFRPFKVITVAESAGLVSTRNQLRVQAEQALATADEADVLIVPGGYGARRALANTEIVARLAERGARAERVLGVGYGCLLLAKAGLCRDRDVAIAPDVSELFRELEPSARIASDELCVSEKLMTTTRSGLSAELALSLVKDLLGAKFRTQAATYLGLEPSVQLLEPR